MKVKEIKPVFGENPAIVTGREILRDNWDYLINNILCCIFLVKMWDI